MNWKLDILKFATYWNKYCNWNTILSKLNRNIEKQIQIQEHNQVTKTKTANIKKKTIM